MLHLDISSVELWNEETEEFSYSGSGSLDLEHSLYAISKWEAKYKKPFFRDDVPLTQGELLDYLRFAIVEGDPKLLEYLSDQHYQKIKEYLEDKQTASTITSHDDKKHENKGGSAHGQFMTSELIYSYMVGLRIPFETQYWNVNRLLMLIQICNDQNQPKKKMPKEKNISNMAKLNAARRAKLGTKG